MCNRGVKTTFGSWFSPTLWVLQIKLKSSGLVEGAFIHSAIASPHYAVLFLNLYVCVYLCVRVLTLTEVLRRCWSPWSWSVWVRGPTWVLGTEHGSSARTIRDLFLFFPSAKFPAFGEITGVSSVHLECNG